MHSSSQSLLEELNSSSSSSSSSTFQGLQLPLWQRRHPQQLTLARRI
jgi:hypothetical protein